MEYRTFFSVNGMTCNKCSTKIYAALKKFLDEEDKVNVSIEEKSVEIFSHKSLSAMKVKSEIENLGFEVVSMKKS